VTLWPFKNRGMYKKGECYEEAHIVCWCPLGTNAEAGSFCRLTANGANKIVLEMGFKGLS